jgi:hypothetical protein
VATQETTNPTGEPKPKSRPWKTILKILPAVLPILVAAIYGVIRQSYIGCNGLKVTGDLRAAMNNAPAGITFCLSGTYTVTQTIAPQTGDKLIGPATIVAQGIPLIFDGGSDVLFQSLDISGARGNEFCMPACGRGLELGWRAIVRDSYIHHNDVAGIGGSHGDVVIENSEFAFNGQTWNLGCCGGGAKFVNTATIHDSISHHNVGNGFWCDVDCGRWELYNVDVYSNTRKGVAVEISNGPVTMDNIRAWDNNIGTGANQYSGGINFTASANITATNLETFDNGVAGLHIKESGTRGFTIKNVVVKGYKISDGVIGCNYTGVTCTIQSHRTSL